LVQASVLIVAGLVSHWKLRKGGRQVKGYALPITILGTSLLSLGMYCCSSIIETGSKEKKWGKRETRRSERAYRPLRILWLQRRHVVSDQSFDAYAIIAQGSRDYILTSHPAHTKAQLDATTSHSSIRIIGTFNQYWKTSEFGKYLLSKRFESATVLGTLISLAGFTLQFIGLRASHWSVSITQLVSTMIMTAVRAIIRRGLIVRPHAQLLLQDHEMDWLATKISGNPNAFWLHFSDGIVQDISFEDDPESRRRRWTIINDADITCIGTRNPNPNNPTVVKMRQRLGQLSKWTGPASEPAISVATAVEIVMDTLFPTAEELKTFSWSLKCLNGEATMTIHYTNGQWKADATQIESILSLWIFHVRKAEEDRKGRHTRANTRLPDGETQATRQADWLREGDAALRLPSMRILCPNSEPARQHLGWWGDISASKVRAVKYISNSSASEEKTTRKLDRHHVVGCISSMPTDLSSNVPQCCNDDSLTFKLDSDGSLDNLSEDGSASSLLDSDLAVVSDIPLSLLFAQHIFYAFMWQIAEFTNPVVGDTTLHQQDPADWKKFRLENSTLRKIVTGVQHAGLGSIEEAYTYIIPPLGAKGKLPAVMAVLELARKQANHHQSLQQWKEATDAYLWLFHKCKAFDSKSPFAVKATALLMETLGSVRSTIEPWEKQLQEKQDLEGLWPKLQTELETADPDVVSAIESVYRAEQLDGWNDAPSETEQTMSLNGDEINPLCTEYKFFARQSSHSKVFLNSYLGPTDNVNATDLLERTPLHYAIALRENDAVRQLLRLGADSKAGNLANWTPLHYASWFGFDEFGWVLLQRGANIDARGSDGRAPLHCASQRGHDKMVKMLLEGGANVNIPDGSRRTALHWAGYFGFQKIMNRLMEAGAAPNAREDQRRTALHLSVAAGRLDSVTTLLDAGADINAKDIFGDSAQNLAAILGHEKVENVFEGRQTVDTDPSDGNGMTPLSRAAENGHERLVRALLKRPDVDINSKDSKFGHTALSWAAGKGHEEVVRALLERPDINVNSQSSSGLSPLSRAAKEGHQKVVQALLERKDVDINSKDSKFGYSALLWAAGNGHKEVVLALLDRSDVDINSKDNHSRSALSRAVIEGRQEVVQALLERMDVDINSKDSKFGYSALSWAAGNGQEEMVRALLDRSDVDINSKDNHGQSVLSRAADEEYNDVVRILLQRPDIEIDAPSVCCESTLLWAAEKGHENVVRFLMERPDVYPKIKQTIRGQLPLFLAAENGHENVVGALLERPDFDINSKNNKWSVTPLSWAVQKGNVNMVRALLERPDVDISIKNDKSGQALLSWAAENELEIVVRALLKRPDIDINSKDNEWGVAPLSWAVQNGHENMVRALLERSDVDISIMDDESGQALLPWAAKNGHENVVRTLLERPDVDINSQNSSGRSPLSLAASTGSENVMQALLERPDIDVNLKDTRYGQSPLSWAATCGHQNVVRALLERPDVDINSRDINNQSPLSWAASNGHENIVQSLLERLDVDINIKDTTIVGGTSLSWAARNGHGHVVRALLERRDVDINSRNNNGLSALSFGAICGHENVVRALLERPDIDINSKDNNHRQSPLSWAATNGHESVVRALLERPDVDTNSLSNGGETPLSWAAKNGHVHVVRALLERPDVNINSRNDSGRSPLSLAAAMGRGYVVQAFLERPNIDITSTDNHSHTALWWATEKGHTQIVELLQQSTCPN